MDKLVSILIYRIALAKEHRNVAKKPLVLMPTAFSMPKNPNGSLVLGCCYLS